MAIYNTAQICTGGVASASSELSNHESSKAFDASTSSFWCTPSSSVPNLFGTGTSYSNEGTPANAFDGNSGTSWTTNRTYSTGGWNVANNQSNVRNLGVSVFMRTITVASQRAAIISVYGSNDGSNWTFLKTLNFLYTTTFTLTVPASYSWLRQDVSGASYVAFQSPITIYKDFGDENAWLRYNSGSTSPVLANSYSVNSTTSGSVLKSWILQGSNDTINWTGLETVTDYVGSFPYTNTFTNFVEYQYYQILVTKTTATYNNVVTVQEFSLSNTTGYVALNNPWIKYQLPVALIAYRYRFYVTLFSTKAPKTWFFQGSNNNSDWTILDTQTVVPLDTNKYSDWYSFTNENAYLYYRVLVSASGSDNSQLYINELEINDVILSNDYLYIGSLDLLLNNGSSYSHIDLDIYQYSSNLFFEFLNNCTSLLKLFNPVNIINLKVDRTYKLSSKIFKNNHTSKIDLEGNN